MPYAYSLNEHVFDTIDTPAKAYWLGFLYCDGGIHSVKSYISLGSMDLDIPEKFKNFLGAGNPLYPYPYGAVKSGKQLMVHSKYLKQVLRGYGIVPCKTYDHSVPIYIPKDDLEHHFWRGCIDADGAISIWRNGQCSVTLNNINSSLLNQCHAFLGGYEPRSLFWQAVGSPIVILPTLNLLYNGNVPEIRLERKYEKYLKIKRKAGDSYSLL